MKFEVNISHKALYLLAGFFILAIVVGFGYAYDSGQPTIHGHAVNEVANIPQSGGCYTTYSGTCLSGFNNEGSLGTWRIYNVRRQYLIIEDDGFIMTPPGTPSLQGKTLPGAGGTVSYIELENGEANLCCKA